MGKITNEQIHKAFEVGKKIYLNQMSLNEGTESLTNNGKLIKVLMATPLAFITRSTQF